jgi:hypothetical protein
MSLLDDVVRPALAESIERGALLMGRLPARADQHPVSGRYVDLFWTPTVGAATTALLRWGLHRLPLDGHDQVDTWEMVEALGRLNPSKALSVLMRTLSFGAAKYEAVDGEPLILLRSSLPDLSDSRLVRLSPHLQRLHRQEAAS